MKCSLCRETIPKGKGKMFVRNDGRTFYFCSSKCQKNFGMGRTDKKLRWVGTRKEPTSSK